MYENRRRLTSWKEIAAHLGRDVRTVLRWEKDRGLPIHRVPGLTGRVVFAYTEELDTWARGPAALAVALPTDAVVPIGEPVIRVSSAPVSSRSHRWLAAAAVVVAGAGIGWRAPAPRTRDAPHTIAWTKAGIVANGADGAERWRYAFPADEQVLPPARRTTDVAEILGGPDPGILTATDTHLHLEDSTVTSGRLLWFSPDGAVRRSLPIEDRLSFGAVAYGAPWSITDFRVDPSLGPRRIAVSAHHFEWWPSLVTVFDGSFSRSGTFVNAGWIEGLDWISRDRLLIAGFSNAYDGGMLAVLDPDALDGQSPVAPGSSFACTSCGPNTAVRYVVLPRSEVNRASGSPFNRVVLARKAEGYLARTVEMPGATTADALYEFTPSLELTRASYSDRYWEIHRQLEAQGKIAHTREQCPDRDGPREIRVWEPEIGWRMVAIAR
jgi:hypothetical protein